MARGGMGLGVLLVITEAFLLSPLSLYSVTFHFAAKTDPILPKTAKSTVLNPGHRRWSHVKNPYSVP